jgi:protein-disulfide isomerase
MMSNNSKKTRVLVTWVALLILLFGIDRALVRNHIGPAKIQPAIAAPKPVTMVSHWQEMLNHAVGPPRGRPHAYFTIVEFADFQCPQCRLVRPMIESAVAHAPINVYFVHCPIVQIHQYALVAAEAADSAAAQGKFWPMYDALYDHQKDLRPEKLAQYATAIGLNGPQVANDVKTSKYIAQVWESEAFCATVGVVATPTIAVRNNTNGEVAIAVGYNQIHKLLKQGLAQLAKRHVK